MTAAVVTGAAKGIGAAIARRLDDEGARLLLLDTDVEAAAAVAADLRDATAVETDVSSYESVQRALAPLEEIDVVVNNAGWDRVQSFLDNEPSLWNALIAINLLGPINVAHVALRRMRRGGRVVNVASDAGRVGSSGEVVYSACKGGVIAFTKALAREAARMGVTANCVCPGPTETPLMEEIRRDERAARTMDALVRATPMRKLAAPEDVASAVVFFATCPDHITGQVLSVSGGLTMAG